MESTINETLITIFRSLLYTIPILLFIGIAIYYLMNAKSEEKIPGMLVLIGNIIIFIVTIFYNFAFMFIDKWGMDLYSSILIVVNGISFIASILFVTGFFLIVKKALVHR